MNITLSGKHGILFRIKLQGIQDTCNRIKYEKCLFSQSLAELTVSFAGFRRYRKAYDGMPIGYLRDHSSYPLG